MAMAVTVAVAVDSVRGEAEAASRAAIEPSVWPGYRFQARSAIAARREAHGDGTDRGASHQCQHDAARAFHGAVLPAMNEGPAVLVKPPRLARESRRPHGKLHLQLPNEKCDEKL